MQKKRFTLIKGNKDEPVSTKFRFIEAYATNTRLMGVIGLRITWKTKDGDKFHQFFHLDAEEYGLDDYMSIYGENTKQLEVVTFQMMGGLGGELVLINEREAAYLVQSFVQKNKEWKKTLPDIEEEYAFLLHYQPNLSDAEIKALWQKICEKIRSPIHLINYFIMRAVGNDKEGMAYLSLSENIEYQPVNRPSTLLKNVTEVIKEGEATYYLTESIIDAGRQYRMILSEIEVMQIEEGWKVSSAQIKSTMNITSTEAAFTLAKKEYILIYDVENLGEVMKILDEEKPHAMKHGYEAGYLYTEFNPDNTHVENSIYYLNEDVYAVYYLTASDQLLVAAYKPERIEELEKYFSRACFDVLLSLEERMDLEHSVLYEFVHSDYTNFYDFLEDEYES